MHYALPTFPSIFLQGTLGTVWGAIDKAVKELMTA